MEGRKGQGLSPPPHLSQLLARGLVLGPLAQVLHALVLGQEVLLGVRLVAVPLVEQLAVGQRAGRRVASALEGRVACPWGWCQRQRAGPAWPRLLTILRLKKWGFS